VCWSTLFRLEFASNSCIGAAAPEPSRSPRTAHRPAQPIARLPPGVPLSPWYAPCAWHVQAAAARMHAPNAGVEACAHCDWRAREGALDSPRPQRLTDHLLRRLPRIVNSLLQPISIGQFKQIYEASSALYTRMYYYQQRPDTVEVVAAEVEEESEEEEEEVVAAPAKPAAKVEKDSDDDGFDMSSEDDEETLAIIAKKNAEKAEKNKGKPVLIAKVRTSYSCTHACSKRHGHMCIKPALYARLCLRVRPPSALLAVHLMTLAYPRSTSVRIQPKYLYLNLFLIEQCRAHIPQHRARIARHPVLTASPRSALLHCRLFSSVKSSVILFVKPVESETNMHDVAARIKKEVVLESLQWGDYELLPVAYGIMKLRIICVIEDDKVALDDLIEAIEEFEEVQSVDIDAFNKL
jgi:translation elongation factor EF-1beta